MADNETNWERGVLEKLAFSALQEQRKARRWSIFFKLFGIAYLALLLVLFFDWEGGESASTGGHTALIDLVGVIEQEGDVSADNVLASLKAAFKDKNTRGIILRINSPGGSPVQAGIIYDEIRRLRALHADIPIYAVVEDICASGGYYIASAADKIYVDKASLIGSIGVIMDQFGFVETMNKVGVERRVLTSGENKAFLDPFSPMKPEQAEFAKKMLGEIHSQFIDVVKKGRGARLKESPEIFSGLIWTGAKGIDLGLADAFGTVDTVARDVIKAEEVVDFTQKESIAQAFAKKFGSTMARSLGLSGSSQSFHLR